MQSDILAGDDPAFARAWQDSLAAAGVRRSVLLASTFRSGSTRIAWNLAGNGLPGLDQERFAEMWRFAGPGRDDALAAALRAIVEAGVAGPGVFTSKVMWPHLRYLLAAARLGRATAPALAALFEPVTWIHVVRQDKIGQAISFWRAKQSGRWHVFASESEPYVPYDYRAILGCLQELEHDDRLWTDFFVVCGLTPIQVAYEAYEADVAGQLGALLAALGLPAAEKPELAVPLRRQRDGYSAEIRERFLDEFYRVGVPE